MSATHLHKPARQLDGFSLYFSEDIAVILINRGENRLNREFLNAFNILLDDVESNQSCKGLITTGVGKFYGNGLDLKWMETLSQADLATFVASLHTTLKRLLRFPLPTVAAINGHAFAGGALMAFAHDIRVMKKEKGWLCLNEVFINRRFANFHLQYLRAKVGAGKNLAEALVLGKRFTAEEAYNRGLVSAMPPEGLLISESVRQLKAACGKAGYPRESLTNMKDDVYKSAMESFEEDMKIFESMKSKM